MASKQRATLNELAAKISTLSKTLTDYLNMHNLPQPSFAPDAPPSLSKEAQHVEIEDTRLELITAAEMLRDLAMGPDEIMMSQALLVYLSILPFSLPIMFSQAAGANTAPQPKHDLMTIYVIDVYKIPQVLPLHSEMSFGDIAAKVGLSESRLIRLLRYAMTMRLFCEPRPGFVAHTAASAAWLRTPYLSAWIAYNMEERVPGSIRFIDALRKYGDSEDPRDTAVHLALGLPKDMSMYHFIASDGEGDEKGWRLRRFSQAMAYIGEGRWGMMHIHNGFDWKALGAATVVDVRVTDFLTVLLLTRCADRRLHWPSLRRTCEDVSGAQMCCPGLRRSRRRILCCCA
jgi:6-hydroxytryprostatin B O-methyltransferase